MCGALGTFDATVPTIAASDRAKDAEVPTPMGPWAPWGPLGPPGAPWAPLGPSGWLSRAPYCTSLWAGRDCKTLEREVQQGIAVHELMHILSEEWQIPKKV